MSDDRGGSFGCGCALVPGLVLGLILYALIGLMSGPPPVVAQAAPAAPSLRLALSETYLSGLLDEMTRADGIEAWQVDVRPQGELRLQAQVKASAFGREMALPMRMTVVAGAADGLLDLALVEAEVPGGTDEAEARQTLEPLLATVGRQFQATLAGVVGGDGRITEVVTTDTELVLLLQGEGDR